MKSSFSARLPDVCDAINRKLGGPVILPPPKSKSSKRLADKRDLKPGSAAKRPGPVNARRTLHRALSTEQQFGRSVSRGPSNAIALLRSATSTSIPSVKREGSEPASLKTLPKGESTQSQKPPAPFRGLSMSNLEDAKTVKKAMVEAELQNAISALRKPNRDVVSRAIAEADQRRVSAGLSAKSTCRHLSFEQAVLIPLQRRRCLECRLLRRFKSRRPQPTIVSKTCWRASRSTTRMNLFTAPKT